MEQSSSSSDRTSATERRLAAKVGRETPIVAWGRAWVSRAGRLNKVVAARTLDFVVCTEHDLMLFSTGFFSRRPRRRVYSTSFDRLRVSVRPVKYGRELVVSSRAHRPLVFQMRKSEQSAALEQALLELAGNSDTAAP